MFIDHGVPSCDDRLSKEHNRTKLEGAGDAGKTSARVHALHNRPTAYNTEPPGSSYAFSTRCPAKSDSNTKAEECRCTTSFRFPVETPFLAAWGIISGNA